ncbi:FAD-dependent monooxygenase [Hamadaea tsunoensis]|uniref:FAD-dependent monooxygenase n=1 Tax=Hamadaea tsunoensis TaxID=53368 RepID=UPI0007E8C639|nr:FAD-dependent monooxygenase [Hamadaea tsunoensis]
MRVAIIGGGVAGSATAVALRRIGAEVDVHEAYPDPAGPVGSFVSVAANGLRGLRALGVLDEVRRSGTAIARQRMYSTTGRLLGDVPRGRAAGDDLHSVTLLRAHLVECLRNAARAAGARIRTGERITDVGGLDADLVLGADGLWSVARRFVDPAAPDPRYAGLYTVSGVAPAVAGVEPDVFALTFARAGGFIHLRAADGTVWWSAQVASPAEPDLDGVTLDTLRHLFRREAVPSAVLQAAQGFARPTLMHVLPGARAWSRGNVLLVGDAAHPVGAGQGASMAIEDAVVLAQRLAAAPSIADALAGFEAARRPRVAQMVRTAERNKDAKVAGPLARRLRDLVMPVMVPRFLERATAWLYSYDLGELPEVTPPDRAAQGFRQAPPNLGLPSTA